MNLQSFKDVLARELFGMTPSEGIQAEICIKCRENPWTKCPTDRDVDEYYISGLCKDCFEEITLCEPM